MGIKTMFDKVLVEEKKEEKQVKFLTELKESDENTIFNLIFSEKAEKMQVQQS